MVMEHDSERCEDVSMDERRSLLEQEMRLIIAIVISYIALKAICRGHKLYTQEN